MYIEIRDVFHIAYASGCTEKDRSKSGVKTFSETQRKSIRVEPLLNTDDR